MPRTYNDDFLALEDLLESFASQGYTLEEVEVMIDLAMDEVGYYDEFDEDDYDTE